MTFAMRVHSRELGREQGTLQAFRHIVRRAPETADLAVGSSSIKLEKPALIHLRRGIELRASAIRSHIEHRCHVIELAPDLAQDIGSRRWFRGLSSAMPVVTAATANMSGSSTAAGWARAMAT